MSCLCNKSLSYQWIASILRQFSMILSPNKWWRKISFLSCPKHCDQGLIVVIVYYFQIWNQKGHKIISSKVISSHMDPMYIETTYNLLVYNLFIYLSILHLHDNVVYSYADACINYNGDTIKTTSEDTSLEKYTSHFIERVVCERELKTEQNCNILTATPLAVSVSFLFSWADQPGAWGPSSLLGAVFSTASFLHLSDLQTHWSRDPSAGC